MKKGIHPDYQEVCFMDTATGFKFVAGSTFRVEISSDSHPFYTGKQKFAAADGRIERFNKKYGFNKKN